MAFFRSYIAPFLIVLIFAIAMLAVSARIFLPSDLAAPAPIEDSNASANFSQSLVIAYSSNRSTPNRSSLLFG